MDESKQIEISAISGMGLDYLVHNPEELAKFMGNSGYDPDSLRQAIASEELQLAILSFFAGNEPALLAMCANSQIEPSRFMNFWSRLENQT